MEKDRRSRKGGGKLTWVNERERETGGGIWGWEWWLEGEGEGRCREQVNIMWES